MEKVGFGGSCHWCTEAIFRSLKGVITVEQGWISSVGGNAVPSEAVIVNFDPSQISLRTLIAVHLHTHSCTSEHALRSKYKSAVHSFNPDQQKEAGQILKDMKNEFTRPIITKVLPFGAFRLNEENYLDYYYKDPAKPFCVNMVNPKLKIILEKFAEHIASERQPHFASLS